VNKTLSFGYRLIDKEENKALWHGMMSCESWAEDHTGMTISRSSEVEIGGRRAIQAIWKLDNPTLHRMTLCFPEIEDGIILKLWAVSEDERSLDIAEQILGTIEFPQSKARSDK
jgi:hypothetical protein